MSTSITVGDSKVQRFDSTGAPKNFTAGPGAGTNAIPGLEWPVLGAAQVAVDNSEGATDGDIYVVNQNEFFESFLDVYRRPSALTNIKAETVEGFGFACGVAVDQANGDVYVGDYFGKICATRHPRRRSSKRRLLGRHQRRGFGSCQIGGLAGQVSTSQPRRRRT